MSEVGQEQDAKWPLILILRDGTSGHGGDCGEGEHMTIKGLAYNSTPTNYCHQKAGPLLPEFTFFPPTRAARYADFHVIDVF